MKHKHGGNIYQFANLANCPVEEVIDFSANINFIKPILNLDFNSIDVGPYPDPDYGELKNAVRSVYSIPDELDLEFFNGASSGIYSLIRFLKASHYSLYAPCYLEYAKLGKLTGFPVQLINRFANIREEIAKESLVVFVNPATPDGSGYDLNDYLFQYWRKQNSTILIDESFLDFTDCSSVMSLINTYDKLYVLKSFTKFYAGAGIRLGCLISSAKNIQLLRQHEPPWKLSTFDCQYLLSAFQDKDFLVKSREQNRHNRHLLFQCLDNSSLFERIYDSDANFILAKLHSLDGNELQNHLLAFKILIRICDNFDFLDHRFIRFAVKEKVHIETLRKAFKAID